MQNPITKERYKGVDINETYRRQICDKRIHAVYFLAAIIVLIGITVYAWNNPSPKTKEIKAELQSISTQYNESMNASLGLVQPDVSEEQDTQQ